MESYSVKNLTFAYPERAVAVLRDLSFSIGEGQFVALCGASGCGKTTLLRQLKPSIAPHGVRSGEILFEGKPLGGVDLRESQKIGFVTQAADNQIVTDKVWHELAFGLESLGMDTPSIRRRVAETASFFGIQTWFHRSVAELSGGQKQILSLASVMAMQPSVLILDEPTAQLDPIAAAEMLDLVGKINRDLGVTVLMTEHRLEEVFPHADRVLVMEDGGVIADGTAREIGAALKSRGHAMFAAMPVPMRVYAASVSSDACPVTVREGRAWLTRQTLTGDCPSPPPYSPPQTTPAVEFDNVWFKYEKSAPDVLKGLSFKAYSGEIHAVLGGNGTGKSTALSLAAGCRKPYRGKVRLSGEELGKIPARRLFDGFLGVLPQNPSSLFVRKTVGEDLLEMLDGTKLSAEEKQARVAEAARICDVSRLTRSHPYDLSGGEQQRAALAKVLLLRPRILLLDEPTKGLDAEFKRKLAGILRDLTARGAAVILVSHDIEFCAEYADRCALFFDGAIVSEADPRAFFAGNGFYTTAANRMARHLLPNAVTANDVIRAVGGTPFTPARDGDGGGEVYADTPEEPLAAGEKLPTRRIYAAVLFAVMLLASLVTAVAGGGELLEFISGGDAAVQVAADPAKAWRYAGLICAVLLSVVGLVWSLRRASPTAAIQAVPPKPAAKPKRKLSKRAVAAIVMIVFTVPLTIYAGIHFFGDRKYYFISALIILETMLPFALVFESGKPRARELVVVAALCAVGVAGRAAFFMLPQFKPVAALVIITGIAFGGETGFLVGAVTTFISNMFFGQGPLTPWQMFAFGIIGFLAGACFHKRNAARSRAAICVFGFLCAFFIYGGIMNPAVMLANQPDPKAAMLLPYYLQGIPFDLVHSAATVTFLAAAGEPMLEKLDRIKKKYGLVE